MKRNFAADFLGGFSNSEKFVADFLDGFSSDF